MSSTRSRVSIALSAKIRGKNSLLSSPDKVDAALSRYAYIKSCVENIIRCLQAYLVANHHESEASVSLGKSILDMYGEADEGRTAAAVFYATRSDSYTANIRTGLVVGVLQGKLNKWQNELEGLDEYVTRFQKVRLRYNHYVNKVSDLEHHLDECENKKKDNTSSISSAKFKLIRNSVKLNDVEEEYSAAAEDCCENLNKTWSERLDVLRDVLSQLAGFLELVHGRELTLDMGLIQLLGASAGRRWIQNSSRVLTPSIPVQTYVHKAGVLRRKQFLKAKVYCRLVGGLLEIYAYVDGLCVVHSNHHDKDSRCQHDLLLSPPKEKHSVKYAELLKAEQGGEPGGLTTGLNVHVDDSHMELIFYASSPNEAQAWVDAFHRAANWDQNACQHEQEKFQKDIESRNEEIAKLLPHSLSEIVGIMGVAEVIERLPPPPPGIPPSLREEMGMEVSSKDTTADESKTSISIAPPNLGRQRATNLGLNKTTSSTTEKEEKRRPLSVSLPLSPLPQASEGFQVIPDRISQHNTIGGDHTPSERCAGTKESSKGIMKMLSKTFTKNRGKPLQRDPCFASWSAGHTPYTSTDGSRSSPVLDSKYSNSSDSEVSGLSSEKRKSSPTMASTLSSTAQWEDLERYKSTNDADLPLSVESLLDWDELQDLIKEGWIREKEVKDVWKECVTVDQGRLESFIRFVKLMDEKRFVHEIAANHGVRLVPGVVYEL